MILPLDTFHHPCSWLSCSLGCCSLMQLLSFHAKCIELQFQLLSCPGQSAKDYTCAAGTAEQAGFFCTTGKKARNQQTKYECTRVKLDRFMVWLIAMSHHCHAYSVCSYNSAHPYQESLMPSACPSCAEHEFDCSLLALLCESCCRTNIQLQAVHNSAEHLAKTLLSCR